MSLIDQDRCKHPTVSRSGDRFIWDCDTCGKGFVYQSGDTKVRADLEALRSEYELNMERHNAVLDSTAGIMAAVMWDLHQRAAQAYGRDEADEVFTGVPADVPGPVPATEAVDCNDLGGHDWDDGKCLLCGAYQFFGNQS